MTPESLSIAAVGDLSFEGPLADRPSASCLSGLAPRLRRADLAMANLESPLVVGGRPIEGKCTLRGAPEWAAVLADAGVEIVTLANNHVMDFGADGLVSTMRALDRAGVRFVGAGLDDEQARASAVLMRRGVRVACLGRTAVEVTAPTRAGAGVPGVAVLDLDETVGSLRRCRAHADLVVLQLHWGLEEYRFPAPSQRQVARILTEAGADVIIGHHPHVTQGIERIGSSVVAYSVGNFVFGEFEWEYKRADGATTRQRTRLSTQNRRGLLLEVIRSGNGAPSIDAIPTQLDDSLLVRVDEAPGRRAEVEALSSVLERPYYRWWWYTYAVRMEWRQRVAATLGRALTVRNILKIRPRHLRQLGTLLRRSARVVSERSANPYE